MLRCPRCEGFVPPKLTACPNCARAAGARGSLAVVGAGAAAITLMACYGAAPAHHVRPDKTEPCVDVQPDGGSRSENPADSCYLGAKAHGN